VIAGQACLYYGAIQNTKDGDLWVLPSEENVEQLRKALHEIGAHQTFLPELSLKYLLKGHAVHYELPHGAGNFRIDIMTHPPRTTGFEEAWQEAEKAEVYGIPCRVVDVSRLVDMKKTMRDKDYGVIDTLTSILLEYACKHPEAQSQFGPWLAMELRSAEGLIRMAKEFPSGLKFLSSTNRKAARLACQVVEANLSQPDDTKTIHEALDTETARLKAADREYWEPRLRELKAIFHGKN